MKTFKNYKEESRKNWGSELDEGQTLNSDQIKVGALLRIADASELMALNHLQLQIELDQMKNSREYYKNLYESSQKTISSFKGQITKLKNRLKNLNNEK
ncbi:hypothetical protein [Chryseobacterium defluvii]|uniref:Uncharacterized protein n=1 Tax=Chryseobacterium defluvii TaxID=160396 RepID=A0A495SLL9_9FLAO|nr:hypothetical protein [Chryseobacterium defluvii]RKT01073.1 hypothetical protein BCF58_0284 [Chryseobacterium defluvii]